MTILSFSVDLPPTANKLYIMVGNGQRILTDRARTYRGIAGLTASHAWTLAGQPPLTGPFCLEIGVWWQDERRRDLDNLLKNLIDSICPALGFDDSAIHKLIVTRCGVDRSEPRLDIVLTEYRTTPVLEAYSVIVGQL